MQKRRGFTLIEIIVALGIFVVIIVALLSNYVFYYKYTREIRYRTIGENLAQLQLEDLRNIPFTSFEKILNNDNLISGEDRYNSNYNCPNYPPAEIFVDRDTKNKEYYFYKRDKLAPIGYENIPYDWSADPINLQEPLIGDLDVQVYNENTKEWETISFKAGTTDIITFLNNPPSGFEHILSELASITYEMVGGNPVPLSYSSGKRDSEFVVEGLKSVPSEVLSTDPTINPLPDSIKVVEDGDINGNKLYNLVLEKWTFPLYKKVIGIEDLNPEINPLENPENMPKKLYSISASIYWYANGVEKNVTVKEEVSAEGQI